MITTAENLTTYVFSRMSADIIIGLKISEDAFKPSILKKTGNNDDIEIDRDTNIVTEKVYLYMQVLFKELSNEQQQLRYTELISQLCKKYALGMNIKQFEQVDIVLENLIRSLLDIYTIVVNNCSTSRHTLIVTRLDGTLTVNAHNVFEQMLVIFRDCVTKAISKSNKSLVSAVKELNAFIDLSKEKINFNNIIYIWAFYSSVSLAVKYKHIFPLILIAGVCLIIWSHKKDIRINRFVDKILSTKPDCKFTNNKLVIEADTIYKIRDLCLIDESCDAFDFNHKNRITKTSYSMTYANPRCEPKSDNTQFVLKPKLSFGDTSPYDSLEGLLIEPGNIYVDQSTSIWYQVDNEGRWIKKFRLANQNDIVNFVATISQRPPPTTDVNNQTLDNHYIQLLPDYSAWIIYKPDRTTKKWVERYRIGGPGLFINIPNGNVSGFKVITRESWTIFIGVSALLVGLIGILLSY